MKLDSANASSSVTYLLVSESIVNEAQNFCDFVEVAEVETFSSELVIHLRAELLDALSVPVCQVSGVLFSEKLNDLV